MSGARRGRNEGIDIARSEIVPINTQIELTGLSPVRPHCFAGLQFFEDVSGNTPAATLPTGTVEIFVKTVNNEPNYEPTAAGTIDASAPETINWAGNTIAARTNTPALSGGTATHYRMVVTCNEA